MKPTKTDLFRKIALIFGLIIICYTGYSQTKVVRGVVTTFTDLPVGNVEITAKKAGSSVKSIADGSFMIVCNTKDVLFFKGLVFADKKVKIKKNTEYVDVSLEFIETEENMEIAIGYGYVSDANKLNAAVKAYSDEGFCNYSNMKDLMQAKFPGIDYTSGQPVLRGISSVHSGSAALIVINGAVGGSLSNLMPCDVVSIDIIKDSGAAIYGAQGANGVIIITTK
jgi:TonB-dependent SusC/RagA subfamily outer membrane receptor